MKGKITSFFMLIVIIVLAKYDGLKIIGDVFIWIFSLNYNSPDISVGGQIFIKIMCPVISFAVVGLIFKLLGLFDSVIMKIVYFAVSSILSFALSWVIMLVEKYAIIIITSLMIFVAVGIVVVLVRNIIYAKNNRHQIMEEEK